METQQDSAPLRVLCNLSGLLRKVAVAPNAGNTKETKYNALR